MSATIKTSGFNVNKTANRIYDNDTVGIFAAETAGKLMGDYVPMETGTLAQSYKTEPFKVIYEQPYAHRMYEGEGFNFNKEKHANATAHWDKAMMRAKGDEFARTVQKFIEKE